MIPTDGWRRPRLPAQPHRQKRTPSRVRAGEAPTNGWRRQSRDSPQHSYCRPPRMSPNGRRGRHYGLGTYRGLQQGDKPREGVQEQPRGTPKSSGPIGEPSFRCFRCNQPGHRAAECPAPSPRKPATIGKATPQRKGGESSRAITQQTPSAMRRGVLANPEPAAVACYQPGDDEDGPEDGSVDPMVRGDMVEGAACQAPGSLTYERGRGDVDGNRPTLANGGRRGGTLGDRPRLGYTAAPPPRAAALTRAAAEHDTGRDDPNGRLAAAPPPRAAAQTETDAKQGTGRGSPNERLAAAEPGFPAAQLLPTAPDVPEWPARQTLWTGDLPRAPAGSAPLYSPAPSGAERARAYLAGRGEAGILSSQSQSRSRGRREGASALGGKARRPDGRREERAKVDYYRARLCERHRFPGRRSRHGTKQSP
ncbi:protein phosphatase 1 regulatory inhibitor subunit 1A PPP1R1A transcript variant X3 mRNA [Crotalus adamanteus]|uniref:Protein phosphatase 1 regulatory inhibitor subunit 1A PPP1R1A transcript variant X3 mRNA n=1 Tax=Crotalus adamanteus TaxID=8729 RepID=A0AAW1BYD2_CROAD